MAVLIGRAYNKGGRGQRNREEIGAGATFIFIFLQLCFLLSMLLVRARFCGFAAQSCSRQHRHVTQAIAFSNLREVSSYRTWSFDHQKALIFYFLSPALLLEFLFHKIKQTCLLLGSSSAQKTRPLEKKYLS